MPSIQLNVIVKGVLVTVINADGSAVFPLGTIDQGGGYFGTRDLASGLLLILQKIKMLRMLEGALRGLL